MLRVIDSLGMRAATTIMNVIVLPIVLWFLADLNMQLKDLHAFMEAQRISGATMELRLSTIEKIAAERGAVIGGIKEDVGMLKYQMVQVQAGRKP